MKCSIWMLTSVSLAFGATAVGTLGLAIATDSWLFMNELSKLGNSSELFIANTTAGLWKFCVLFDEYAQKFMGRSEVCIALDYGKSLKRKRGDGQETSTAIAEASQAATPLPVSALILMVAAVITNIIGNVRKDVKTLVSGVIFIISGLALAVGVILYITTINDEATHYSTVENKFKYSYGWSFFLVGISFVCSQTAAVMSITLYLRRNSSREDLIKIIPGLDDKFEENRVTELLHAPNSPTLIL